MSAALDFDLRGKDWLTEEDGRPIKGSEWIDRMGNRAAWRALDGREHSEFPRAA